MRNILLILWEYLRAFSIIYFCLYIGRYIESLLPIAIPGSIIGMLLLFTLLITQLLPLHWIKASCRLLIRYMALLFVPICVSIMNYTDILIAQFGAIFISCSVSTLIVLLTIGILSQRLHNRHLKKMGGEDE